jgi:hypothetical protein
MRNRIRRALRSVVAASAEQRKLQASPETSSRVRQVEGIIQQVDPVGREMPVVVDGVAINFYVPLHCDISVNDEPARMRLLQPRDRARLAFFVEHGISRALSITVSSAD